MSPRTSGSISWARAAGILTAAVALRAAHLGTESLWFDEAYSVRLASRPVSAILAERWIDIHPPLYYLLLHAWVGVAGTSEVAVRSLSLLLDVAAIVAAWRVASRLLGRDTGALAALLLALSPFRVEYAQETRMYALLGLLSTVSMGALLSLIAAPRRRTRVVYAVSTALMLYTHAYGAFVAAAQLVVLAGGRLADRARFDRAWRPWLTAAAGAALLYAPWLPTLIDQAGRVQSAFWIDRPGWLAIAEPFRAYAGSSLLLVISAGLCAAGVWSLARRPQPDRALLPWILLAWIGMPTIVPFVLSRLSAPIFLPKYTIAASVPFAMLVAAGVIAARRRAWRVVLIGALVLPLLPVYRSYYGTPQKDGWRRAVARLEADARPGDLVVFYPWYNQVPYDYYHRRDDLTREPLIPDIHIVLADPRDVPEIVARVAGHQRLWFVVLQGTPRRDVIVEELSRVMRPAAHTVAEHVELWRFEASGARLGTAAPR
ncbi:MAG: glycosyltransferase family 39 protein [Acidobacteria bacterium]|nr:glycosyltransferase family 39 protein [Acidobacteriota bacterium]